MFALRALGRLGLPTAIKSSFGVQSRFMSALAPPLKTPKLYNSVPTTMTSMSSNPVLESLQTLASAPSAHPSLVGQTLRFGPRWTTENMTWRTRKRRSGFLSRINCRTGRLVIKRRKAKGRKNLSC